VRLRDRVSEYVRLVPRERAALVCGAALRAPLADLLGRFGLRLEVFAYTELPPELELRPAMVLEPEAGDSGALTRAQAEQSPTMVRA